MTGGGSGGHITPLVAVARRLKQLRPDLKLVFVGQRGESLGDIINNEPNFDAVFTVRAGKFRRYHGEGWRQILAFKTQAKNLRDAIWVVIGLWQSFWLMHRLKPAIIFSRGGFVSVPVCLGGKLNGVPYITHDSDSLPSLANRLIARWASLHAVALSEALYPYEHTKTVTVGIPLSSDYQPVTNQLQQHYRTELGLADFKRVVCVTGGGNGARDLNKAVADSAADWLGRYPDLVLLHISGRALEKSLNQQYDKLIPTADRSRVIVKGFATDFYRYSGAADVVIARAGATSIAEFALQGRACVLVPNASLSGGHQLKNAESLARSGAVIVIDEAKSRDGALGLAVAELLDAPDKRRSLAQNIQNFAKPNAADNLAQLILKTAELKN